MRDYQDICSKAVLSDLKVELFKDAFTTRQMEFLVNIPELFVIKVSDQVLKEKIRLFTPEDLDAWLGESHEHLPLSYAGYDIDTYEYGALLLKLYTMADIDSFAYAVRTEHCPTSGVYSVCIATINEDFWTSDHTIPIQALVEAINILREQLGAYGIVKAG
jgi:hypothetical protein